jgi:hypothetical protein
MNAYVIGFAIPYLLVAVFVFGVLYQASSEIESQQIPTTTKVFFLILMSALWPVTMAFGAGIRSGKVK